MCTRNCASSWPSGISVKPRRFSSRKISSRSILPPKMRRTSATRRTTGAWSIGVDTTSTTSPTNSPPPDSRIICATRSHDNTVDSKSAPRSNRCDASVCIPCRRAIFRTIPGSHHADSITMFRVFSVIMVSYPPITPASPTGFFASQTTRSSDVNLRTTPSRVFRVSPSRALRTTIFPPSSRSMSNTCVGFPISQRT